MTSDSEVALLREEVATLSHQLKQLARVEHALTRSRRETERHSERIRRLAQFAFNSTGAELAADVLDEARSAMLDQFELDDVVVVRLDPAHRTASGNRQAVTLEPQPWDELATLTGPLVCSADSPPGTTFAALCRRLGATATASADVRAIACIPVRPQLGDHAALLLGWTTRSVAGHRDLPNADHLPFLQLFGNHVSRAIDSAHLTAQLRAQGVVLTQTNQKLTRSLQELERTQAQLVQAQKLEALGRLAGGIAHDFNNLLTVIVSHADLVRENVEGHPEASEDVSVIIDAAKRAGEITRRLLAFGRKRDGSHCVTELNAATVDLSRMLRRLIGDDVVLQVDLDPGIGRVRVDPVHLEQILMNLVVNARDAMPHGGQVSIATRQARPADHPSGRPDAVVNMVALSVTDTGSGMDEATRQQLFEPFFTTKPIGKGTGLGLATVYGLVQQNQGHIHVTSRPGEGSSFTVLLPNAESSSGVTPIPMPGQRGRILVVEDEDAIRRMVSRVLRREGFEVIEARDGREAVAVSTGQAGLDLVLTDVVMPAMGGPELIAHLRATSPQLKAVFMSGHTFDRLDVAGLNSRLETFLPKPFTPDDLKDAVETALEVIRARTG